MSPRARYNEFPLHIVKPVYNDHLRDWGSVVSVDRWSLYGGALVSLKWPAHGGAYSGHYRQVVFMCEWSLRQVSLYNELPDNKHTVDPRTYI